MNEAVPKSTKYKNVQSKVKDSLSNFKTFNKGDNLDDLINKVEREIKQLEEDKK